MQESVTVRGQAPTVETTKSEVAATVTAKQIDTLPIEGRSAITLSLLLPGTSTDATRAQRPGASVGLGGLSTAGTNYIVDGMNNMISRAGDAREDIPQSAIQEFKVIVSQAPAEYGGRVGGVVNVVTKSGGNQFHGEGFEFFRDKSLNRVDRYAQQNHDTAGAPIPDFRRDQFGGRLADQCCSPDPLLLVVRADRRSGVLHRQHRQAQNAHRSKAPSGRFAPTRSSGAPNSVAAARVLPISGRPVQPVLRRRHGRIRVDRHRSARLSIGGHMGGVAARAQ